MYHVAYYATAARGKRTPPLDNAEESRHREKGLEAPSSQWKILTPRRVRMGKVIEKRWIVGARIVLHNKVHIQYDSCMKEKYSAACVCFVYMSETQQTPMTSCHYSP